MGILREMLDSHLGKIIGVIIGLFFGWFAIKYGLFKALFVAVCAVAGYYIGKRLDENFDFKGLMENLFREKR
ncbi:MAG: putative membrane protein [Pelotomaculum thermopropionicum]|uniref:Putative membrane protein n=1 Tax=Pelotomaculum thermopropionicum TaxID=110500 RepID=A0A117M4E4_9FIRM|nr:MAG: putative membrane protein [Pelotomaculum thermopropionicum]